MPPPPRRGKEFAIPVQPDVIQWNRKEVILPQMNANPRKWNAERIFFNSRPFEFICGEKSVRNQSESGKSTGLDCEWHVP